jgi:hypothetical protein
VVGLDMSVSSKNIVRDQVSANTRELKGAASKGARKL